MDESQLERYYNLSKPYTLNEITIGHFNRIYQVVGPFQSYILRIYESNNDMSRIHREWSVMKALKLHKTTFGVPTLIESVTNESIVFMDERHQYATLMPLLEGSHPDLSNPRHQYTSGRALAELNQVLCLFESGLRCGPSYSELDSFHRNVKDITHVPDKLPVSDAEKSRIQRLILSLQEETERVYDSLPKQLIHGDYTNNNRLIERGKITGIIDFEFCCYDVRVMDLAIGLGGGPTALWEYGDGWGILEAFGTGYLSLNPLTKEEILSIPFLIRLRRVAMLAYFYGRYVDGLDTEGWLRGIVHWVLDAEDWLQSYGEEFTRRALSWSVPNA